MTPDQWQRILDDNKACQDGIRTITDRVVSLEVRIFDLTRDAADLKRDVEGRPNDPDSPGIRNRVRKIEERLQQIHDAQAEHGRTLSAINTFMGDVKPTLVEWNNIKQQTIGGRRTLYVIGSLLMAGQGVTLYSLFQILGAR